MPFTESVKQEAKRRSDFCCIACRQPFVEVHHIIPQAQGGSNDLDNAAPLCAQCHDIYGQNPDKRKQIREMRDWWWEVCKRRHQLGMSSDLSKQLDELKETFNRQHIEQQQATEKIKTLLIEYFADISKRLAKAETPYEIADVSGISLPLSYGMVTDPKTGERGIPIQHDGRTIYI